MSTITSSVTVLMSTSGGTRVCTGPVWTANDMDNVATTQAQERKNDMGNKIKLLKKLQKGA
ncbi:MAG: hypothetical protein A3D92_17685 [Bacteroidetes bacterium RIFCSPHIGHO2_02_FULL_44_7]|nr:MAG: hypothetical protein A3D92_17685 [Bacteroidetes bacterium RIFCSPHIGHO2_02_FULL_44_7]